MAIVLNLLDNIWKGLMKSWESLVKSWKIVKKYGSGEGCSVAVRLFRQVLFLYHELILACSSWVYSMERTTAIL
jgi:hypothetical protein